ncbi:nidogen-like domain-containing protein, partial [Nitrosomonas sp. Is37]|uniref:nidogen-like domain-containing protein n=1 Tax=Nitrosomonas sp. Is37 TaxID=3080535 RepID=UPI00294B3D93
LPNGTEDTPYTVNVSDLLAGFSDVDDDVLNVSELTASNGTVTDNGDGTFTITPSLNFNGPVTLNYSVIDGNGGSVAATQNYTTIAINDQLVVTSADASSSFSLNTSTGNASAVGASYLLSNHNLINTLGGTKGFGENYLGRNDDGSTGAIDITSIFGDPINFFGTNYSSLFLNNNGNITFTSPWSGYTPSSITAGISGPIIAPFWGDVDTREAAGSGSGNVGNSTGSNLLWYDLDSANGVFTATWDDVEYYNTGLSGNAFQLQLINQGNGDFDILFRYEDINWTAGRASGGNINGLGGSTARVGYNAQNGINSEELPQSGNEALMLDLPDQIGNTNIPGVFVFQVRNGQVVSDLYDTGTIQFSDADLTDTHIVSVAPENNIGSLTATLNSDTTGTGAGGEITWTYNAARSDIMNVLSPGETMVESFTIYIDDQHGGVISEQIDITIIGVAA